MTPVTPMKPVRKRVFSRTAVRALLVATSSVLVVVVIVLMSLMMTAKPQGNGWVNIYVINETSNASQKSFTCYSFRLSTATIESVCVSV